MPYLRAMVKMSRKTAIVTITAFVGVMVAAWPFQSVAAGAEANDANILQSQPSKSDPNGKGNTGSNLLPDGDLNADLFKKMMQAVGLVIVLSVAALYVSKKVLPKITNMPGKRIKVVETAHLGPRRAVHLIEVDNHRMLVGSTNERITKLADITEAGRDFSVEYSSRIENEYDA